MSDAVFYRFQPDAMERETLERLFKGEKRKELLERLTREIETALKNRTPRYYLIIGPRGVGKTHFITMLYCNVEEQIENALPIKLSEEEFSIYRVSDLLLRILDMIKEKEMEIDFSDFERMADDEVVVAALEELKSTGKIIVLFLENLNQILGEQMSKKEVQRLRSIFQTENIFSVVTTAPLVFPQVSEHTEPFFNFFDIIYLREFTRDELKELVGEIARIEKNEEFLSKMDEYAQKINAVYFLTGGSPRMAILLYDLMSKGDIVDVEKAFFKLLDESTLYYQDLFRLLSGEKRKVFDTLIALGKPATPTEIAIKARLDNKTVNTLLRRLEEDGYVRSRKMGKTTKYEVRERLFRLWRELRRQPFAMQKLSILVEFLELWYKRAIESSYLFLSLPKEYKKELMPQVVKEIYEIGEVKLVDEFLVYGSKGLKDLVEFKILFKKKKYEEFLKKAEEKIKVEENNAFAWFSKGVALINLGRHGEALDALSKSIELNPDDAGAWHSKGLALINLGRHGEALEALSKSIELNPDDAGAWHSKGLALINLGRHGEALEALSKSIELNPDIAGAWHSKGLALGNLGRHGEALDALSKSIELNPDDVVSWCLKGVALGLLGRYEEALQVLSKSIELNPDIAFAWLGKGLALSDLDRPEEALDALSKSIELNPDDAFVWRLKGTTLKSLRRYEEALDAFSKSIELEPKDTIALFLKGGTHLDMSLREFNKSNYGNTLENLNAALNAFDTYSGLFKDKEKAKEKINEALMTLLKKLIDTKNVEAVDMALSAISEKKEELKKLFEPVSIAL